MLRTRMPCSRRRRWDLASERFKNTGMAAQQRLQHLCLCAQDLQDYIENTLTPVVSELLADVLDQTPEADGFAEG